MDNLDYTALINGYADMIHADADAHGLFDGYREENSVPVILRISAAYRIREEVHELRDASRDIGEYAEEMADVILITLSFAKEFGINIGAAIEKKRLKNIGRPYQHKEVDGHGNAPR